MSIKSKLRPTAAVDARPASGHIGLAQTKLQSPRANHQIVAHDRLLALHPDAADTPVVTVVAPAGYGKSTILAEWAAHASGRVLWITLDRHDDDPAALVSYIAAALLGSGAAAPGLAEALSAPSASVWSTLMPRLSAALHDASPFTLILDDAHAVSNSESWDVIDWLSLHVPEGGQVVVAGRSLAGSSMARLEVSGRLVARGVRDLALDDTEAFRLLRDTGASASREDAARLNRECEGWVSGLLMNGLASGSGATASADPAHGEGLVDDFVRAEVLAPLDEDEREFLLQLSVLRLASPSLCDSVMRRSDSHLLLQHLCDANAFVARVGDGWCKLHELLRSALLRQLVQRDPELVADLRDRAAMWHAAHGNAADAVSYSMDSGFVDHTTTLIGQLSVMQFGAGRQATIDQWLDWAEVKGLTAGDPLMTTAASLFFAITGRPERSERWAGSARHAHESTSEGAGCLEDDGHYALLAAWQCGRGAERMLEDASRATELLAQDPWHKSAQSALGVAQSMNGLPDESASTLRRVVDEGGPGWDDANARSGAAALLAVAALRDHDLEGAVELIDRASRIREENGITEQGQQALNDAVAARVTLLRGADVAEARRLLAHAQRIRALITWAMPALALLIRLELIKAHLALADTAAARVLVRESTDILRRRPGLGAHEAEALELQARVADQAEAVQGPSSLTTAELRLVPWLATHLSFREIGERLFLSTNTVKTEALSTYRKLGASSRSEAVEAAVRVGLMDPAALPGILGAGAWRSEEPSNHP